MLFGEVHSTDHHYLQQLAIIQRQMIEELRLDLIRCNHYGPKVASLVREFCLEVWLGCITSIRQHDNQILMCVTIAQQVETAGT